MKITNHTNLRKRVSLDCSKPVLTDQSSKKSADINNIMLNYSKTGLLPQQRDKIAQYIDNTQIPSLMEAHEQIQQAKELFEELPAQVRKMMNNNPVHLPEFLQNPDNAEICYKYGILNRPTPKVEPKTVSADPPSGDSAKQTE